MKMSCECQPKHPRPRKLKCCPGVEIDYIEIPVSAGTDAPGQPLAPENGAYKNAVVKYAANNHVYIYTSEGIPVPLSEGGGGGGSVFSVNGKTGDVVLTTSDLQNTSDYQNGTQVLNAINTAIGGLSIPSKTSQLENDGATGTSTYVEATALSDEATARENADNGLQGQIDALSAASDVTDIVGTYAALQAYDTSTLGNNDIIKVLQDETHDDETTYYRWSTTTQTFTLIGEEGPYYTKSAADQKFQDKLTAGTNINIDANNEISATDTTYSDFTGTDGQTAGTAGLVPAPATTDAGKYLKADGTWDTAGGGGPTVVQATGTSTTDVMSQDATTKMIWPKITDAPGGIIIGSGAWVNSGGSTPGTLANGSSTILIGKDARGYDTSGLTIGPNAVGGQNSIVIGAGANAGSYNGLNPTSSNTYSTIIGPSAHGGGSSQFFVAIGSHAGGAYGVDGGRLHGVALGAYSACTRAYEVAIGSGRDADAATYKERYLANVKDPQLAQDAATKNYVDGDTEAYTIADTDWSALTGAGIFTYSATVTATHTIGASTIAELINDQAVLFSTYGFAIGDITGQTVTIYSIGAPSSSASLKINYKG